MRHQIGHVGNEAEHRRKCFFVVYTRKKNTINGGSDGVRMLNSVWVDCGRFVVQKLFVNSFIYFFVAATDADDVLLSKRHKLTAFLPTSSHPHYCSES